MEPSTSSPAKRGSNLACLKCRAIKVKCWKSNPNDPRCARCNRLDLFCEFREHHRGKKLEKVIADENRNLILSPEMLRRARLNMLRCSSYPLNVDLAAMVPADNAQEASFLAMSSAATSQYGAAGLASTSTPSPPGMATSVYDDVIRMNGCSWTDACYLFSLFSTQLNPIVALLEPGLYTVQYTREQSPILFSVILSISSRFFRPDLQIQCQAAAAAVLKFALSRQLCSIDHIQALFVSAIWSPSGDASRAEMLSAAIAYAYELGLPFCFEAGVAVSSATKPYTPTMPAHLLHGGHQSTILRMQQRAWIQLCLMELSQQSDSRPSMQKRPGLIAQNDFPNVRAWYELNNSTMSAYDARLAYQLDFALSQRSFNRLSASTIGAELSSMIESLQLQERDCFATWFNTYGDEYVARYGMDRYSNAEAGYLLLLYRFARAVQLHSTVLQQAQSFDFSANSVSSHLEHQWFSTATDLAFRVLDAFISKVLDQDATSSSMLRLSPQYMASGCLSAARWLLSADSASLQGQAKASIRHHPSTVQRARERVSDVIRLLAQPLFYPDGNRVPTANEITGQLDQTLRSMMGDGAMLIGPTSGTSPKRARAHEQSDALAYQLSSQGQGWGDGQTRKQRRRTSNDSLIRIELDSVNSRSVGAMSGSAGSDRGGSEWSPHPAGEKWNGGGSSGYVSGSDDITSISIEASLGEPHWPPSLLNMTSTSSAANADGAATWTPTSEGAMSSMAMASSISPPASASSAVFSVSASALPDHLDLGLASVGNGSYVYGNGVQHSSLSIPSLPLTAAAGSVLSAHPEQTYNQARSYERQYPYSSDNSTAASLQGLFATGTGEVYQQAPSSQPLARNNTATQQSRNGNTTSGNTLTMSQSFTSDSLTTSADLDALLTVGLSTSYDGSSSSFLDSPQQRQ
ncbi:hypothetical protein NDA16_002313 [Ustilago loliicola]|nr:hypothetical protein NDA16_002313 [Ustilago loliicola]